jgi:hypothetical protein
MSAAQEFPRIFPEIENLDDGIARTLAGIKNFSRENPALVIVKLNMPPGEMFRLPGTQYGLYFMTKNDKGEEVVCGMRIESHLGPFAHQVVMDAIKMAVEAQGGKLAIYEFTRNLMSSW